MKSRIKKFLFEEENSYDSLADLTITKESYINNAHELNVDVNVDINIKNVSSIDDIYKAAEIEDLSKSIYKVEEIKEVLPNTLPMSTKKESVLGMMQISGVSVEEVLNDFNSRNLVLKSALESFSNETIHIIESHSKDIELLEEEINKRKESINSRKLEQEEQEKIIKNELEKINSIAEFIK